MPTIDVPAGTRVMLDTPQQGEGSNGNFDYRPQRRESDAPGKPYPWKPGHTIAMVAMALGLLVAVGVTSFAMSDACVTAVCEQRVAKKLELLTKQTDADIKRADDQLTLEKDRVKSKAGVEKARIEADKLVEQDRSTERRAIANSSANARAGFGNNDVTTKQFAVGRGYAPARPLAPAAPVYAPARVRTGCVGCGEAAQQLEPCDPSRANRPRPRNDPENWFSAINPNSGECTWVHKGKVPIVF